MNSAVQSYLAGKTKGRAAEQALKQSGAIGSFDLAASISLHRAGAAGLPEFSALKPADPLRHLLLGIAALDAGDSVAVHNACRERLEFIRGFIRNKHAFYEEFVAGISFRPVPGMAEAGPAVTIAADFCLSYDPAAVAAMPLGRLAWCVLRAAEIQMWRIIPRASTFDQDFRATNPDAWIDLVNAAGELEILGKRAHERTDILGIHSENDKDLFRLDTKAKLLRVAKEFMIGEGRAALTIPAGTSIRLENAYFEGIYHFLKANAQSAEQPQQEEHADTASEELAAGDADDSEDADAESPACGDDSEPGQAGSADSAASGNAFDDWYDAECESSAADHESAGDDGDGESDPEAGDNAGESATPGSSSPRYSRDGGFSAIEGDAHKVEDEISKCEGRIEEYRRRAEETETKRISEGRAATGDFADSMAKAPPKPAALSRFLASLAASAHAINGNLINYRVPAGHCHTTGIYEPSRRERRLPILLAVDTSGSIDRSLVCSILSKACAVKLHDRFSTVEIALWTTRVYATKKLKLGDYEFALNSGGTSMSSVAEHYTRNRFRPAVSVYITDGEVEDAPKMMLGRCIVLCTSRENTAKLRSAGINATWTDLSS